MLKCSLGANNPVRKCAKSLYGKVQSNDPKQKSIVKPRSDIAWVWIGLGI
jgi:hypothetical protein